MSDLCSSPSFPKELLDVTSIKRRLPWDLDGDGPVELRVPCLPDAPEFAHAYLFE
jgi:hypothetical protein